MIGFNGGAGVEPGDHTEDGLTFLANSIGYLSRGVTDGVTEDSDVTAQINATAAPAPVALAG